MFFAKILVGTELAFSRCRISEHLALPQMWESPRHVVVTSRPFGVAARALHPLSQIRGPGHKPRIG
jgi:hypothetical protein